MNENEQLRIFEHLEKKAWDLRCEIVQLLPDSPERDKLVLKTIALEAEAGSQAEKLQKEIDDMLESQYQRSLELTDKLKEAI